MSRAEARISTVFISWNKPCTFFGRLAEKVLRDHGRVELYALEAAIVNAIDTATYVERKLVGKIEKVRTDQVLGQDGAPRCRVKIVLHRTKAFVEFLERRRDEQASGKEDET